MDFLNQAVKNVMKSKLLTLHPKDKVSRLKEVFEEYEIHHVPIVVMNKLVGIVSQGDVLVLDGIVTNSFDKFIQQKTLQNMFVEEIMARQVITAPSDMKCSAVIHKMVKNRVNAIPIVDGENLVGLITAFDILQKISTAYYE